MAYYGRYKPTEKQRQVANLMLNGKSRPDSMRQVGYSKASMHNSHKLIQSKGYQLALLEEANSLRRPITALVAKANLLADDDTVTPREALQLLDKLLNVTKKIEELAGVGAFKGTNDPDNSPLAGIIDVTSTNVTTE